MALTRPLSVALAAAVLLVVVVGADATMDRSLHLDRQDADGAWVTLASGGEIPPEERYKMFADPTVRADDVNATLTMRVRVENGYPWSYDEAFVAYAQGVEVARGRVEAEPRGAGATEFEVPLRRLAGAGVETRVPDEGNGTLRPTYYGSVEVRVGRMSLQAGITVEVVQ